MPIKILVKVKKSEESRVESFGSNRYLVYSLSDSNYEVKKLLSKHLGTPIGNIYLKSVDTNGNKIFEVG